MTHRLPTRRCARWLVLLVLGGSCATTPPGPSPAAPAPATAPASQTGGAAAPPLAPTTPEAAPASSGPTTGWAAMNFTDRRHYMKTVVMPKMKEVFVAFDASRYAKVTCATCHGDGASEGSFRMPNPGLPRLPTTPDAFKKLMGDKPAISQFMLTKVKPAMAKLLGVPEMTPENKIGFGCLSCHGR
jgi:hypothetical protein